MKFRKQLIATATATLIFSSGAHSTGVPTVDILANTTSVNQWIQKLSQWTQTVQHYKDQMDSYKAQLATVTGIRDVQTFLGHAKNLANDIKAMKERGISLNDLLSNPDGAYSGDLNSLYDKYKVFDSCNEGATGQYLESCKKVIINQAAAIEDTTEVQDKISDTLSDIADLSNRIQYSKDPKESQDLANVVSAKSVQLSALTTQWEMSVKQAEQRSQMLEIQKKKAFSEQQRNAPIADLNNIGH
ncbi:type IV secretion system protein [Buttiauxella sp. A2-C2_NF]|uniref:type IV secretion system protein n=1 Tax=Buttiauxella ferragutiae TaxID=82989 RepID=UPI001E444763|nr:type IV secretion system protein [Buttiauxella ferragutiae]MCE0826775.1 type IV secretion system protein [Buttiauxella ferragutiae]